jgi:hypothetical protein
MFAQYLRIIFIIFALIGGVLLFAFAFTTAAIVVGVLLLIGLVFGGRKGGTIWVFRREREPWSPEAQPGADFPPHGPRHGPITIDHDPNDLPPDQRKPQ